MFTVLYYLASVLLFFFQACAPCDWGKIVLSTVCVCVFRVDKVEVLFDSASYHPFHVFFPPSGGQGRGRRPRRRLRRRHTGTPERGVPHPFPVRNNCACSTSCLLPCFESQVMVLNIVVLCEAGTSRAHQCTTSAAGYQ